jgi:hypothetical protein
MTAIRDEVAQAAASDLDGEEFDLAEILNGINFTIDTVKDSQRQMADACADGMHSWVGLTGKLPANTPCDHCGELYGDPE